MAKKTEVYVDTAALIAVLDGSDTYHSLFAQLFADPPALITSPLVIAEGQGWFLKRYDISRSLQFMSFIEELKVLRIFPADAEMVKGAHRHLKKFADQELTFVDASGLWLMEKRRIRTCWSTDRHLALTGVPLVIYE